jgi:hypothetical protein
MLAILPADSDGSQKRIGEIAAILATGLLRLQSRKSSQDSTVEADSSLDCERHSGGDVAGEVEVSRP